MRKELKVQDWWEEIEQGLKYRRLYGLEDSWASIEAMYANVERGQDSGPNIIASTGDALLSALSVPYPSIALKSLQGDTAAARVLENVDNGMIEDLAIGDEIELSILHAFLWGRGTLKIGFDSEFGWRPDLEVGRSGGTMSQFDRKGNRIEFQHESRPGMPWIASVHPHDLVVPYGTRWNLDSAPWVAHRIIRHVEDVKADPKYKNTSSLQPCMSREDFEASYEASLHLYRGGDFVKRGEARKSDYVELWEIHDRRTGQVIVIATGYNKFLRKDPDFLQLQGFPFVSFTLVKPSRAFWVTPDGYYLRQPQAELTDIAIQAVKQRRIGVLKLLASRGIISEDEAERLLSPDVGAIVWTEEGHDLREAVLPIQLGSNLPLYQDAEVIRRNARESVGFSRNQMGEFEQSGRRTATEAMVVDQASDRRMSRREKIVRKTYETLFRKLNEIIFAYWKMPRIAEVVSPEGASEFIRFKGSQLRSMYRYTITFGDEAPMSRDARRQWALQMYAVMSQNPYVDPMALLQFLGSAINDPEMSNLFGQQRGGGSQSANSSIPMLMRKAEGGAQGAAQSSASSPVPSVQAS